MKENLIKNQLINKIFITLFLIFLSRLGIYIPLPYVNIKYLNNFLLDQNLNKFYNIYHLLTGGALKKISIFSLGLFPYISASIIIQIINFLFPYLNNKNENKKLIYSLSCGLCILQSSLLLLTLNKYPEKLFLGYNINIYGEIFKYNNIYLYILNTCVLTFGTFLLIYIGHKITKTSLCNGISMLIGISILSDMPKSLKLLNNILYNNDSISYIKFMKLLFILISIIISISLIIYLHEHTDKIKIQYSHKRFNKFELNNYYILPIKLNYAGVMPVIFSNSFFLFFKQFLSFLFKNQNNLFKQYILKYLIYGSFPYYILIGSLIILVNYIWLNLFMNSYKLSEDLSKNGWYIRGIRPGYPTAQFINQIIKKNNIYGSFLLTIISLLPELLNNQFKIPYFLSILFGGTGTFIAIGLILELNENIQIELLNDKYLKLIKNNYIFNL